MPVRPRPPKAAPGRVVSPQKLTVLGGAEGPGLGRLAAAFQLISTPTLVLTAGHPDQTSRQVPGQRMVGEQLPPQRKRPGAPDTHGLVQTPPLDLEDSGHLLARKGQAAPGLRHDLTVLALACGGQTLACPSVGVRQGDGQLRGQAPQELALAVGQVQQAVMSETGRGDAAVTELGLTPASLGGHSPSEQVGETTHLRQAVLGCSRDHDLQGLGGRVRGDGGQDGLGLGAPCGVAAQGAPGAAARRSPSIPTAKASSPLFPQALPLGASRLWATQDSTTKALSSRASAASSRLR